MRLTQDVHLVGGSSTNGFGLSGGMDSHIYVIDGGASLALIDCGMAEGNSIDQIVHHMDAAGLDPDRLEKVFITHHHVDHVGGLHTWQARFGLRAAIAADAAEAIEQADIEANSFRLARDAGVYPPDYQLLPARIDDRLDDGATREVGHLKVRFIATPGHCTGHGCYLVEGRDGRYLFSGDSVFHGGSISLLNTPDSDLAAYRSSILRLATLPFDALLPGHGALALSGGADHVQTAADAFQGLTLPESFV